ncbi:putative cell-wall-anchored protein SasA (LPXTG motif) [Lactococcus cremoris]|uniref:Putative cell-wall-anchored protein SasA (LPXTG motif) n=1 Tax=Lactococcus lactis subsp. cremoris TaxID=1359 RepID=A0A166JV21_LACLC|nr:hypothetical protein [Lactococcus cremoris]KZK06937.1 putative cell-wall-anchored protein SasA (LPXTG motif) [Lactococcus cremoris]
MKKSTLSKTSIALLSIAALFGGANLTHADSTPVQNASEINNVTKNVVKNDSALMSGNSITPTNGASFSSVPTTSSSLPTDAYYPTAFPTYTNPSSNTLPTAPSYYAPKDSDSIGNATTSPTSSTGNTTVSSGSGQTTTSSPYNPTMPTASSDGPASNASDPNKLESYNINYVDENGNIVKSIRFSWARDTHVQDYVPDGYWCSYATTRPFDKNGDLVVYVWSDAYYQKMKDAVTEGGGVSYTKDTVGNATSPTSSTGNTTAPSGSGQTVTSSPSNPTMPTASSDSSDRGDAAFYFKMNYIDENGNIVKSIPYSWDNYYHEETFVPSGYIYAENLNNYGFQDEAQGDNNGNWLVHVWSDAYFQKMKDIANGGGESSYTKDTSGNAMNPTSSSAPIAYPDSSNGPSASMVLPNTPATMSPTTPTSGTSTPTIITPTSPTGNSSLPTSQPTVSSMTSATTSTSGTSAPTIITPTTPTSSTGDSSSLPSQSTVSSTINLSTTKTQATPTSTQPTPTLIRSEVAAQKITPVATNVGVNSSINRKSLPITGDSALISDELSLFGLGLLGVYTLTRAKIKKRD